MITKLRHTLKQINKEDLSLLHLNFMRYFEEDLGKSVIDEYKKYDKISARTILKTALLNSYRLDEGRFNLKLTPEELSKNRTNKPIKKKFLDRPSKSVEGNIDTFLENSTAKNIPYEIIIDKTKRYKKYNVPYSDCIIMLLSFIYQDGRIFNKNTTHGNQRIPTFKIENSCSLSSYKTVIREVLNIFPNYKRTDRLSTVEKYDIYQLCRIDKIFQIFRLNRFALHYKQFMSDETLDRIYDCFKFTRKEVAEFPNTLEKEIFKDDKFIKLCLNSVHLDPLYVFIYFFQKYLNIYSSSINNNENYCFNNSKEPIKKYNFQKFLAYCKTKTEIYLKHLDEYPDAIASYKNNIDFYFSAPRIETSYNKDPDFEHKKAMEDTIQKQEDYFKFMNYNYVYFEYPDYNEYPWHNYYYANREPLIEFMDTKNDDCYMAYLYGIAKPLLPSSLLEDK